MTKKEHIRILLILGAIFFVSAGVIATLYFYGRLAGPHTAEALLGALILAVFFLSALVYELFTMRDRAQDIAEGMTEDLLSSRDMFLSVFKNSPVPYVLVNADGSVTLSNLAASRLFDKASEELQGVSIIEMLAGDAGIATIPTRLKNGVALKDEEASITLADGKKRWVMVSAFPFTEGEQSGGLLTLVDVTKQKEIDTAKTEFVSLASHQLRTPISAMKWNMELLLSKNTGELTKKQHVYTEKMEHGIARMEAIVNDFLNVSKLELGTLTTDPKQFALADFFESVLEEHAAKINEHQLNIKKEYTESELSIVTDERLLRMVLGNLISNAAKYTPAGGSVVIGFTERDKQVVLSVADSGMGIPAAEQEKLFTKLFRASNVREEVPDGSGLGLYIVSLAVAALGGTISFTSAEGKGTTFEVVLPA